MFATARPQLAKAVTAFQGASVVALGSQLLRLFFFTISRRR
jgi:hypothetical protein